MIPQTFTRAQTARRYLKIRESFGLTDANPVNSTQAASAALAEAIAEHSNTGLAEVLALAEAVLSHRDFVAGASPAEYDIDSLADASGSRDLAVLAVKLCGGYVHNGRHWIDDGVGEAVLVTFPVDLFSKHLAEWSERV